MIARLGKEINDESSYLYWAYKVTYNCVCLGSIKRTSEMGQILFYLCTVELCGQVIVALPCDLFFTVPGVMYFLRIVSFSDLNLPISLINAMCLYT